QTKGRDEARPRAGVLRTREFIMKDAYSFDRDREGLDASYELQREAYDRIFDRVGLEWYRVESDVGAMGGFGAHEYMAPCPAGEDALPGPPGFLGPTPDVAAVYDAAITPGRYVGGANRPDYHVVVDVDAGERLDVRSVVAGDRVNGQAIRIEPAIEVGNIFK